MAELSFKVIVIGPGAVGKSSIIRRYIEDKFTLHYKFTIGVDFSTKTIDYEPGKKAKVTIWDIGGQDRFKSLRRNFYEGTHGALVVFDLSRAQTFPNMKKWVADMNQMLEKKTPTIILGNKSDLISEIGEAIDQDEIKKLTQKIGSVYLKTSAKSGENVEKAFVRLTKMIVEQALNE